jgi:hypothetical protein
MAMMMLEVTDVVPPNIGTRALVLEIAWANLCPEGAFLAPPTIFHTVPPTKPTDKQHQKTVTSAQHISHHCCYRLSHRT